jgi:hypothetical protein
MCLVLAFLVESLDTDEINTFAKSAHLNGVCGGGELVGDGLCIPFITFSRGL